MARAHLSLVGSDTPVEVRIDDFDSLFDAYAGYVAAIVMRLLGRDHEVDDVVQDVFVGALNGLGALRHPEAVKGWLGTVAVRLASRRLRVRKLRAFVTLDAEDHYAELAIDGGQEHAALLASVYRVLDRLPVADRVAWTLRVIAGEQLGDVAELCGCSLATAKRRIASAQAVIEEVLGG